MQAETRLFAEHMIAQKREVLLQEGVADEARQQAQDEAWSKRLAVWGAEQEAREMLMAQVLDERRIQVRGYEWARRSWRLCGEWTVNGHGARAVNG